MLLLLVIETAWQLTVDLALNIGVMAGGRYAITGTGYSDGTRDSAVLSKILSISGGILSKANLTVTTQAYASPTSYASSGAASTSTGSSGQLVVYQVTYKQNFLTALPTSILGYGSITHKANLVVQNEPF